MKIIKIAGAFFRGAIKAFPLGNAIIEGVNNAKGGVLKTVVTPSGETISGRVKEPHSWISIVVQIALIVALIYGVCTKQIDINYVIEILQGL